MRYVFFDHCYPAAFDSLPHANHTEWFQQCFGTSDFWECALESAGHTAQTWVWNFFPDYPASPLGMYQEGFVLKPDIVVSMEVGRFRAAELRQHFPQAKLVAFCSHRADDRDLMGWDCIFSSFPWMPEHCKSIGVRCEYLPLAFGKPVLDRVKYDGPRDIPVSFIGGLGMRTWKAGTEAMAKIAEAIPEFQWWGYVQGSLSDMPPALQKAYRGEAYGRSMYELLLRSLVVVNRHGEIARGASNNCRIFESQGCGCLLLNDTVGLLDIDGIVYRTPEEAVQWIRSCMEYPEVTQRSAWRTRERVLANHTFEARVPKFIETVESL